MSDFYESDFCEHDFGEPEDLGDNVWRVKCKICGFEEEEVLFVEYWIDKTITVVGKIYHALKSWGNISLCSECEKPIFNVPLILWDSEDPSKALTFHFKCAEELKILKLLVK